MKKAISSLMVLAALASTGCASRGDVNSQGIQIKTLEERITGLEGRLQQVERVRQANKSDEAYRFCFNNGQAYSEGSILAGRICQRATGTLVYADGKPVPYPLAWTPWKY